MMRPIGVWGLTELSGIFPGMISYPSADEVAEDLGDKVINGFARSVALAAADLQTYRNDHPEFVSRHSERGLANWIHDMLWHHLVQTLLPLPEVVFHEAGPTREIFVGTQYRLRAKRHTEQGAVSNYDTQTALEFMFQELQKPALPELEEIRLLVGYVWDPDANAMGSPVLSLRDGKNSVQWQVTLGDGEAGGKTVLNPYPAQPGPAAPGIDTSRIAGQRQTGEENGSA